MSATYVRTELQIIFLTHLVIGVKKIWIFCLQKVPTEVDDTSAGAMDYNLSSVLQPTYLALEL